jgi:thioredoxin 1
MLLNKDNFKQEVEDSSGLVLVDFFAPWCGPCQMMLPIVEEMAKENKDPAVKISKLNIDEAQDIAVKYNVMSVPSFLLFKNGQLVNRITGYCPKEELEQMLTRSR